MLTNPKTGMRVAYSADFLRSTGQFTEPICFAKGEIRKVVNYGEMILCEIIWDNKYRKDCQTKVASANLTELPNDAGFISP